MVRAFRIFSPYSDALSDYLNVIKYNIIKNSFTYLIRSIRIGYSKRREKDLIKIKVLSNETFNSTCMVIKMLNVKSFLRHFIAF